MAEIKKEVLAEYMLATIKDEEHSPEWRSKRIKHIYHLNADVNARLYGKSMLSYAKERGEEEIVKFLEEKGAKEWVISKEEAKEIGQQFWDDNGCFCGEEILKKLMKQGADVNCIDKYGCTALIRASLKRDKEIVELLIENCAEVDAKDDSDLTALMYASMKGHKDVAEVLIKKGGKVNQKRRDGWTALMYASSYGHKDVVEILLENGAYVNHKDCNGRTALMYASRRGHKDIAEVLENRIKEEKRKAKVGGFFRKIFRA